MDKVMKTLVSVLLYLWQLPQNLLGFFLLLFYKEKNSVLYKGKKIRVCEGFPGGISLGNTVIVSKFPYNKPTWDIVKHEWGHTRQSLFLGPFYLIVIGVPSAIWALWWRRHCNVEFSSFYTEKWADKLGNL
jgi:hypothetical protein